jgi:hypothetical protein
VDWKEKRFDLDVQPKTNSTTCGFGQGGEKVGLQPSDIHQRERKEWVQDQLKEREYV